MNEVKVFQFQGNSVRVVNVNGEPWFVAKDVADVLGYRMASDMCRRLDEDEKGTQKTRTLGGEQEVTVINESGLYNAVAKTSILVGEMAKLIKQATGTDIGQNRFFEYLRKHGYLHSFGSQKNLPTQRSMDAGWFEIKEGTRLNADGVSVITRTPKITGKGQIYFINLFSK